MRKRAVAVALSGLLLMTGCTSDDGDSGERPEATESQGGGAASGTSDAPTVGFGQPHDFEDGVTIKVSRPKQFRPSANATTGGEPDYIRFTIVLTNKSKRPLSTSGVSVTVESGDGQAGDVIDRKNGLPGPPSKRVAPDTSAKWPLAFGVLDPKDVTVDVQVGMERETVVVGG